MKKSLSSPSLSGMGTTPPSVKRCVSAAALPIDIPSILFHEMQLEAVTHTPAFHAGKCMMYAPSLVMDTEQNISDMQAKEVATCLASPADEQEEKRVRLDVMLERWRRRFRASETNEEPGNALTNKPSS